MEAKKYKAPTKAVIAAAGFGTRFLPQTKAMPKEMMPIIDKPIIQYVVEELVEAGIKDIIIVGNGSKRAIEDHFDLPSEELLINLRAGGPKKAHLIDQVNDLANLATFTYVRQKGPYGNATPLLCASHLIGDEPFIYKWADDFFYGEASNTKQLIDVYQKFGGSVLACKRVENDSEYDKYGIANGEWVDEATMSVAGIDEKPGKANAKSDLASVSEFLFTPEILNYLRQTAASFDGQGELMIQPAIQHMIDQNYKVFARAIQSSKFYDTGDKLEYLKTMVDFGIEHESLGADFLDYLRQKLGK